MPATTGVGKLIESMGGAKGVAGAALGLIPTIAGLLTAGAQRRKARAINPVDPGFQENSGIIDNQRMISELYGNYSMPGKQSIIDRQNQNFSTGLTAVEQGATSGADVLDGVTTLGAQAGQNINALGVAEAEQKNGLIPSLMDANAAAGNEAVRRNQFDEARYQALLAEKAALNGASAMNGFNAVDNLATLGGTLLNYRAKPWTKDKIDGFEVQPSIFKK